MTATTGDVRLAISVAGRTAALSPLRYPGGKGALAGFFGNLMRAVRGQGSRCCGRTWYSGWSLTIRSGRLLLLGLGCRAFRAFGPWTWRGFTARIKRNARLAPASDSAAPHVLRRGAVACPRFT